MNEYHVIDIANSLDELEQDYNEWQSLPYDFRVIGDDNCLNRYGMTNTQFYNMQRANFIKYSDWKLQQEIAKIRISDDDGSLISKNINDLPDGCTSSGEVNVQADRILASRRVHKMDDEFIVIPDWLTDDAPDYTIDDLTKMYNDYILVPQDHKDISNSYSIKIWGRSVPEMYKYMKAKFQSKESDSMEDPITVEESVTIPAFTPDYQDQSLNNFRNTIMNESGDDLQILMRKLDCLSPHKVSLYESKILESYGDKIKIGGKSYRADIPGVVPFLQYDEYVNNPYHLDMRKIHGGMFPYILSYDEKPVQRYHELQDAWRNKDDKKMLEMGWNPIVKPTPETLNEARERQIEYLDKLYPANIIDISEYSTNLSDDVLNEAVDGLPSTKQLHPIFIVLGSTKSETIFSKFSNKLFSDQEYSNVGISFDSKLQDIYTFEEVSKQNLNRMRVDTLDDYKYKTGNFRLITFFVNTEIFNKLKNSMRQYMTMQDNSPYTFDNVFAMCANVPKLKHRSMAILCASMLDAMYTIANVRDKLTGIKNSNAKIHFYILYTGNTNTYKFKDIDRKVKILQKNLDYNKLNFFEPDLVLGDIQYKFIENFNIETSDEKMNSVLKEIRNLLTPTDSFLFEQEMSDEELSNMITDSIDLLSSYGENDVEGMKREVANLIYYIDLAGKKPDKDLEDILNKAKYTINFYTKIIKKIDSDFEPFEYIKGCPFANKLVRIDRNMFAFDSSNIN